MKPLPRSLGCLPRRPSVFFSTATFWPRNGRADGSDAGEVWLETIFPSVWGLLSTRRGLLANANVREPLQRLRHFSARFTRAEFAGRQAIRVLPANLLERLLLPGFSGHVVLKQSSSDVDKPTVSSTPESPDTGLALCLMPFNLASIGVLDIVHLLCKQQQRVVAKISEKVEFVGPILEKILAPFIQANALRFVYGGPDVGAELAARPRVLARSSYGQRAHGRSSCPNSGSAETDRGTGRSDTGDRVSRRALNGIRPKGGRAPDCLRCLGQQRSALRQLSNGAGAGPRPGAFRKATVAGVLARRVARRRQRWLPQACRCWSSTATRGLDSRPCR